MYCFKEFFTAGVKMPRIELFHVTKPKKMKCLVLSR